MKPTRQVGRSKEVGLSPESFCYAQAASLLCRRNLTPPSDVCEVAPIFLFWADPRRTQRITGNAFEFSFNLIGKLTMAFVFIRPIMARTQILVHRWGPRTVISALFRRGI